jgi:hypothetical protein
LCHYDELNRIDDAIETIGGNRTWRQDFSYDRYGNRNFVEANTTTLPKNCGTSPNFVVCTADKTAPGMKVQSLHSQLFICDKAASTFSNWLSGKTGLE